MSVRSPAIMTLRYTKYPQNVFKINEAALKYIHKGINKAS